MYYTVNDFDGAPRELLQYVLDNVVDFDERYQHALRVVGVERCPLRVADHALYQDICDIVAEWCEENGQDADNYSVTEIFG